MPCSHWRQVVGNGAPVAWVGARLSHLGRGSDWCTGRGSTYMDGVSG